MTWRDAFWAAAFLRDFAAGERPTLFKRMGGDPLVTRHLARLAGRRPVPFDLYVTPSRESRPRPPLVVAHGFAHEGAQDPRLQALCRRLARLGWAVIAPEFAHMREYRLSLDDTDDLETVVLAADAVEGVAGGCGILAFSFGSAPVLLALDRACVRQRARFALVFGGCFDLRHATRYVLTGAYDLAGLSGRVALPAERDDRWKFLKGNLHLIPESPSRARFARIVDARIADPECAADTSGLSAEERMFFALVDNRDPAGYERLYGPLAPYMEPWIGSLSPKSVAKRITTPLVIIHSRTDQKTHYSESVALSRAVPRTPLVAIVNTFAHVDLSLRWQSPRAVIRDVVPGLERMWAVASALVPPGAAGAAAG